MTQVAITKKVDWVEQALWLPTIFILAPMLGMASGMFLEMNFAVVRAMPQWALWGSGALWGFAVFAYLRAISLDREQANKIALAAKLLGLLCGAGVLSLGVTNMMASGLGGGLNTGAMFPHAGQPTPTGAMQSAGLAVADLIPYAPFAFGVAVAGVSLTAYLEASARSRAKKASVS